MTVGKIYSQDPRPLATKAASNRTRLRWCGGKRTSVGPGRARRGNFFLSRLHKATHSRLTVQLLLLVALGLSGFAGCGSPGSTGSVSTGSSASSAGPGTPPDLPPVVALAQVLPNGGEPGDPSVLGVNPDQAAVVQEMLRAGLGSPPARVAYNHQYSGGAAITNVRFWLLLLGVDGRASPAVAGHVGAKEWAGGCRPIPQNGKSSRAKSGSGTGADKAAASRCISWRVPSSKYCASKS